MPPSPDARAGSPAPGTYDAGGFLSGILSFAGFGPLASTTDQRPEPPGKMLPSLRENESVPASPFLGGAAEPPPYATRASLELARPSSSFATADRQWGPNAGRSDRPHREGAAYGVSVPPSVRSHLGDGSQHTHHTESQALASDRAQHHAYPRPRAESAPRSAQQGARAKGQARRVHASHSSRWHSVSLSCAKA
jgi:hypothetical protein